VSASQVTTSSPTPPTDVSAQPEASKSTSATPGEGGEEPSADGSTPPDLGPDDAGRPLTLQDVRNRDTLRDDFGFADDTFKIGNTPTPGIGGPVKGCGRDRIVTLDLRPAQQFQTLSYRLGQDANSTDTGSTNLTLVTQIWGNDNEVLVTKRAKITSPTDVEADIKDVVAAQIVLYIDDTDCTYDSRVTAVVSDLKLR